MENSEFTDLLDEYSKVCLKINKVLQDNSNHNCSDENKALLIKNFVQGLSIAKKCCKDSLDSRIESIDKVREVSEELLSVLESIDFSKFK